MVQVFDELTVLDFSQGMAGSIATMIMSDHGAEVIKVEPPGGDPYRVVPPSLQWNRGKKSVTLDLEDPDGQAFARQLALEADVVVETFRPGEAERLGIAYDNLCADRPDLVYASLRGWGSKGPYAHYKPYEAAVAAKIGRFAAFSGQTLREGPHYPAVQTGSHAAAMALIRGISAALIIKDRTGQGQLVETSLLRGLSAYDFRDWLIWQLMIKFPDRFQEDPWVDRMRMPSPGYMPIRTLDGHWIQMANVVERPFHASMHALGLGWIYEDPRFENAPTLMPDAAEDLRGLMLEKGLEKTLKEWMEYFIKETPDVAAEPFMTAQEGMNHPQMIHNGHVQDVEDPRVGRMRQLGPLGLFSDTPGSIKGPAPTLGQHTEEVLGRLNGSKRQAAKGRDSMPKHPLEGILVLDLATVIAGPLACALLAEMGARVVRIEAPDGDLTRGIQQGIMANRTMAGAQGTCIDLKTPEGLKIVRQLAERADVLVHNMRPGAPERLGIGYEQLKDINPGLVYVYAGGYGATGPYSHRPSMHPIPGAVCGGALAQMGRYPMPSPEENMPMDELKETARVLGRANEGNPDPNSSMAISACACLGLYARHRTGKGQYIVSSMIGANAYANADDFFWYEGRPRRSVADAEGYGLNALYRAYQAKGGGWVFLACPFEEEWHALCETIGRGDLLEDPRFVTAEPRLNNDEALAHELEKIFATKDPGEWERDLARVDVCCVEIEDRTSYHFWADDPHVSANNLTVEVDSTRWGAFWRLANLLLFSHTQGKSGAAPLKGEHNHAVLQGLGYSDLEITSLEQQGVLIQEQP